MAGENFVWQGEGLPRIEKGKAVISEEIVNHILEKITRGELKAGELLPSEKQLIALYQVSRGCVREALRTLQIMNVITIQQGKGAFVSSLDVSLLVQHLGFVFTADADAINHLFDMRKIFEPEVAAVAAVRVSDEELDEMRKLVQRGGSIDSEFHRRLSLATGNPFLVRVMSTLWQMSEQSRKRTSVIPGVRAIAHQQHAAMVEALSRHDADTMRTLMREHLEFLEQRLLQRHGAGAGTA